MLDSIANHEFGLFYVLSQIFALTATILNLYAIQRKKKEQLLKYNAVAAFCGVFHYLFLGAWSGVATKIVGTTRNSVAAYEAYKHKISKVWPIIFITFYIVGGIITYSSPLSILPIIAAVTYTMAIYLGDASTIRRVAVFTSTLWLIYDICVFSIVGTLAEIVFIIDALVAIWRYRKHKKKRKKRKSAR